MWIDNFMKRGQIADMINKLTRPQQFCKQVAFHFRGFLEKIRNTLDG